MKCNEIRELMLDLAAEMTTVTSEMKAHLDACVECACELEAFRQTMTLLDEWEAPEPSPYFDVRLRARLRDQEANQPAGWLQGGRKPALAISLAVLMVASAMLLPSGRRHAPKGPETPAQVEPGTAVGDLQALDKNDDLYSDFDVLDDLQVQQNVSANP